MKKRFLTLLLAAVLCLNLSGTAFAADGDDWDIVDDGNGPQVVEPSKPDPGPGPGPSPTPTPTPDDDDDDRSSRSQSSKGEDKGPDINYKTGENGTVTLSPTDPKKGDTVTITVTPAEGYIVGSVTVTTNSGKNVVVLNQGGNVYTFTMPGEKITIATTFRVPTQYTPGTSFSDVPSTEWYAAAVAYVSQNGMMAGSNGRFSPNDRLTRGMMAQILYNIEKASPTGTASFPDVPATEWFANAAAWASTQGFMSGYSNGNFGPNDPITREQLAAILYRYASAKGYDVSSTADISTYSDASATSDWAAAAVRWAVGSGLLSGKAGIGGSRLDPTGTATRAEVAQILMNFATKIAK